MRLWSNNISSRQSRRRVMMTMNNASSLKRRNLENESVVSFWVWVRLCFLIVCIVDSIVNDFKGFLWSRRLIVGHGPIGHDDSMDCPFDYEGSWAIGMVQTLPSSTTTTTTSPVDGTMWQNLVDESYEPTLSCSSVMKKKKKKEEESQKKTSDRLTIPNVSFVADPFLLQKNQHEWYVFFEYKNADKHIGELGVAKSTDAGQTFDYLGTVLKEDGIHLSYPHVFVKRHDDPNQTTYQMIPETNQAKQVRIYETSQADFPFGWKHVATPLRGEAYVDTSVVWYEDRHVIFTSTPGIFGRSLLLFEAVDLVRDEWTPHPNNPIVKSSFVYARSGGRPFVYQNHIYRMAQDGTKFYGQAIHMLRVHVLTHNSYKEQHVATIQPKSSSPWTKSRFHHMDIQPILTHDQNSNNDDKTPSYVAFFDADPHNDSDEFMAREGWFYYTRKIILIITCLWVLRDFSSVILVPYIYPLLFQYNVLHKRNNQREMISLVPSPSSLPTTTVTKPSLTKSYKDIWIQKWKSLPLWKFILYFILSLSLAIVLLVIFSDFKQSCIESDSHPTAVCMRPNYAEQYTRDKTLQLALQSHSNHQHHSATADLTHSKDENNNLLIVTAASTSFMIRLRNLIGSIHYWEPSVETLIYDLGFSSNDLKEIATWKRCTVVPFPFEEYPPHVQLLYNFAWKIVLFDHALNTHGNFMYLDAGVEVLRPLTGVRHYLKTDGYFSSIITNTIGKETHPSLYSKLDDIMKDTLSSSNANGDEYQPMNVQAVMDAPFCAGGIQGFVKGSKAEELILKPALKCALDEHCIAPLGSGRNNHNYDQSVLATLAHANGLGHMCHDRKVYCSPMTIDYTIDETRCNGLEIAGRRWRGPRRYPKHIDIHYNVPTTGTGKVEARTVKTVEVLTGKKPQSKSAWQECEEKCSKDFKDSNGSDKTKKKIWETCMSKCPKDTPKQFWNSDQIDVIVIEYFSYWLKGLLFGCSNYRLHTVTLTICLLISLIFYDRCNTKDEKEKQ